jgi:hypothetical protein
MTDAGQRAKLRNPGPFGFGLYHDVHGFAQDKQAGMSVLTDPSTPSRRVGPPVGMTLGGVVSRLPFDCAQGKQDRQDRASGRDEGRDDIERALRQAQDRPGLIYPHFWPKNSIPACRTFNSPSFCFLGAKPQFLPRRRFFSGLCRAFSVEY